MYNVHRFVDLLLLGLSSSGPDQKFEGTNWTTPWQTQTWWNPNFKKNKTKLIKLKLKINCMNKRSSVSTKKKKIAATTPKITTMIVETVTS